jgi:organic radical activating enzyme
MKSLRLIITTDCNLSCEYCCNKIPEVNNKFIVKNLLSINFKQYDSICITGGEPLLDIPNLMYTLNRCLDKNFNANYYLYTNGLLLTKRIFHTVSWFDGINIGIHSQGQLDKICNNLDLYCTYKNIRFLVEDINYAEFRFPENVNIKTWTRNQCNIPNEDWILIK